MVKVCYGFITGSANEAQRLLNGYGLAKTKVAQIPNPIDTDEWQAQDKMLARESLSIPVDAVVVMWHGRTDFHRKGLDVLLQAWKAVYEARGSQSLRLLLVGSGADAAQLRMAVADLGVQGIRWLDHYVSDRERIRTYLSAADLFVFPSRHEGFAVAPLEAMACGLPLVSTDAGGMADVLERGEADGGVLVPREDSHALSSALGRLIDDEKLRQQIGLNARQRIEAKYSLEAVGSELVAFIERNA
jgi:starch synthase